MCPSLNLTNGMISYTDPTLGVGSVATHSCNDGYVINGTPNRTCEALGRWNGSANCTGEQYYLYSCYKLNVRSYVCYHSDVSLTCPPLSLLSHGNIFKTNGSMMGSLATYTCDFGYQLNGTNDKRLCEDGQWTGMELICRGEFLLCGIRAEINSHVPIHIAIECDLIDPSITGGSVELSGTTFMSNATYSCSEGYKLNGSAVRMCDATEHWVPDEPTCDRRFSL